MSRSSLKDSIGQFVTVPESLFSAKCKASAKWLFVCLRSFGLSSDSDTFPSYDQIQKRSGLHRRNIAAALRELESVGWISRARRFNASTLYTLHIPPPEASSTVGTNGISSNGGTNDSSEGGTTGSSNGGTLIRGRKTEEKRGSVDPVDKPLIEVQPVKKPRKGSGKASQQDLETFCKQELQVPESDGYYMFLKFEGDGWPKNWQMKLRQWKAGGFLPSQKQNGSNQRPTAPGPVAGKPTEYTFRSRQTPAVTAQ